MAPALGGLIYASDHQIFRKGIMSYITKYFPRPKQLGPPVEKRYYIRRPIRFKPSIGGPTMMQTISAAYMCVFYDHKDSDRVICKCISKASYYGMR